MVVVHHTDLLHTVDHHQTGRLHPAPSTRLLRSHPAFLYRLRPVPVSTQDRLNHHHSGCVNRLCWSPNGGTYLGSVSDDRTIRVWVLSNDQVLKKCRTFPTLHQGNVFGIRFLDSDPDQLRFATGSREGTVCVTVADQTAASSVFRCHRDSVMEIEQSLDRPGHVFWSASDDCTVRQWDLRCPVRCRCRQGEECTSETILIDGRRSVGDAWRFSSICSSPTDQNLILTGCGTAGRLFDRRMLSPHSNNSSSRTKPCQVFMPSWLSNSSHDPFVTHTNFSPDGRRIVVNYNGDHAYVFSIGKAEDEVSGIPMVNPRKHHDQDPDYFRRLADEQVQLRHWDNSVRLYSNALSLPNVTPDLKRVLLVQRSKALLNRRWLGDTFAALRDVQTASSLLNGFKDVSVMNQLNECLDELGQIDRAADLRASSGLNGTALDGQVDYATRLVGHANIETGIKEATFLSNDIVGCASDDGIVYVYDAASGVILHTLSDGAPETLGLNTVRSHPNLGVSCIATSGLDHHIQLFTATGSSSHCTYNDDHRYLVHFNQQSLLNNHSHLSVRHLFFFRTVELEDFDE